MLYAHVSQVGQWQPLRRHEDGEGDGEDDDDDETYVLNPFTGILGHARSLDLGHDIGHDLISEDGFEGLAGVCSHCF